MSRWRRPPPDVPAVGGGRCHVALSSASRARRRSASLRSCSASAPPAPRPLGGRSSSWAQARVLDPLAQRAGARPRVARRAPRRPPDARPARVARRLLRGLARRPRGLRRAAPPRHGIAARPRRLCFRVRSRAIAFVHLAEDGRARAFRRASCSSHARGDLLELCARSVVRSTAASVGSLNSLLSATLRISAVIPQRVECRPPNQLVFRVACDRPRARGCRSPFASAPSAVASRAARLRDDGSVFASGTWASASTAARLSGSPTPFERLERDVAQHGDRLRPHAFVRVVSSPRRRARRDPSASRPPRAARARRRPRARFPPAARALRAESPGRIPGGRRGQRASDGVARGIDPAVPYTLQPDPRQGGERVRTLNPELEVRSAVRRCRAPCEAALTFLSISRMRPSGPM